MGGTFADVFIFVFKSAHDFDIFNFITFDLKNIVW